MKSKKIFLPIVCIAFCLVFFATSCCKDNKLVILHTNDTHSQIIPGDDGLGGVMRRMAVIDSVRKAEKNVLLVDAGDAVQGSLYFFLYGGQVEQEIMNILGVDARILGNHEFDNGIDSLATILAQSNSPKISTNYNLENTPLKDMFEPYIIKEYGGKRIGIIGINLDPTGIISKGNYDGLEFLPIVATANLAAGILKNAAGVDAVIALTHIGYNPSGLVGDSILATNSRNIDIIIGGHSHDTIDPTTEKGAMRSSLINLDGQEVLVVQAGKAGRNIGKIEINLDSLGKGGRPKYELIRVDARYDDYYDSRLAAVVDKYSIGVDSLMHLWVGESPRLLNDKDNGLLNYFADFVFESAKGYAPGIDLSIANKGGLRAAIPEGKFSKGHVINMVPFANFLTVVDVKGSDLLDVFNVMAVTDGNGVSKNVAAKYIKDDSGARVTEVKINGKAITADKVYRVATIDYLAKGGDYMTGLTRGNVVAQSKKAIFNELLDYISDGKGGVIGCDTVPRWNIEK
ncbi:MAG: bifunctional metallophosphatase/5'-nucleotidase [Muribaculaceae bacterium]|nr:bifunctional metallophosphatase/5'-nucleotidase [Muribaculaceae bacterium]